MYRHHTHSSSITSLFLSVFHLVTLGRLYEGLLHDLRNILQSISLFITNPLQHPREYEMIQKSIAEMHHLLNLTHTPKVESFSTQQLLQSTSTLLAYKALRHNVRIITYTQRETHITAHYFVIQHALLNVMSNAIDAYVGTQENHISRKEIIVTASENKHAVIFTVQDFAGGIDRHTLKHVFKKYFTTKPGHTGIGLHFVKKIIHKYERGLVTFDSTPGKGVCCTITLPKNSLRFGFLQKKYRHRSQL